MKENRRIDKYFFSVIAIAIIIIVSTMLAFFYLKYLRDLTSKNTFRNLGEVAKQDAQNIEDTIEEHKRILETIVNIASEENVNTEENIFKIYETNAGKDEFSRIAILYKNGKTDTSDGSIVDLSEDVNYFFQTDDIQISKTRKSKVDTEEINIYSKKMLWNGQDEVVILLVVETEKFESLFSQSLYNGNGIEYLITKQGEITANSRNEENGKNIFDELKKDNINAGKENERNIEKMYQDISQDISGQIIYRAEGNNYYISYQYLELEDWFLVIVTPGSIVAEELNSVLEVTFFISITIIIIIFIVSTYIIINNKNKKEKLYKLAYVDEVTGIGNKNYFLEMGKKFLENNIENAFLLVLDIDKFKSFNQKYGHRKGNELLYKIGEILTKILGNEAIVTRLANDAFGIIFEEKDDINKTIDNIEKNLTRVKMDDKQYQLYISIGIYKIKNGEKNVEKILDKALIAHDKVKGNYDKQYMIFNDELEEILENEHEIELNMENALENKEFEVYYQPKIELVSQKLVGAEALVRWKRDNKIISPNEFIPLFEKNQFIIKLDTYIFSKVCEDIKEWKKKFDTVPLISVNVSKEHLLKEDFIKEYVDIVEKNELKTSEIELEITETATTEESVLSIIKEIKKEGFVISIDDFGTGYSSLSMLHDMPIDTIKIDKTFIRQIDFENNKKNIVQYIIFMAKQLEMKTIAEGVETEEEIEYLKSLGCDFIQGYYYSKPLNKKNFEDFMNKY